MARAALWLDLPKKHHAAHGEVLPLFSKQLEHWRSFQRYWQWGNRGAYGRRLGADAFVAAMKQDYTEKGEMEAVADKAVFESMARRKWQFEQPKQAASPTGAQSSASAESAMTELLASYGFTRPFSLAKGPPRAGRMDDVGRVPLLHLLGERQGRRGNEERGTEVPAGDGGTAA